MKLTNPKHIAVVELWPEGRAFRNTETSVIGKSLPIYFGSRRIKQQVAAAKSARKALRRQKKANSV